MAALLVTVIALPGSSPASTGGAGSERSWATPSATLRADVLDPVTAGARERSEMICPPNAKRIRGGCIPRSAVRVVAGERCRSARKAVPFFRARTWTLQEARGGELADRTPIVRDRTCRWARVVAAPTWVARAKAARRALERWVDEHLLRDFAFGEGRDAWPKAVRVVQVVFPGTEPWLLSCSDAEGWSPGFDRWVGFGGVRYSDALRDSDTVGGPGQFRFSTFKGMFRKGLAFVEALGYVVPQRIRGEGLAARTRAWRSALGQAIAMGWARWSDNDDSHWSASWGRGC